MRVVLAATKQEVIPTSLKTFTIGVGLIHSTLNTSLILSNNDVSEIILTGLARSVDKTLKVGDLVTATKIINWQLDLTSFKLNHGSTFDKNGREVGPIELDPFNETLKKVTLGSADKFLLKSDTKEIELLENLGVDVVDMESYAVATVAQSFNIPLKVIRVISDDYLGNKPKNFKSFLKEAKEKIASLIDIS
jgi:nucleoside phosphorylase